MTQWPVSRAASLLLGMPPGHSWTPNRKVGVPLPPAVCTDRYPFISSRGRVQTGKEDGREGSKGPREPKTSETEKRISAVAFCSGGAYQGDPLSTRRTPSGLGLTNPPFRIRPLRVPSGRRSVQGPPSGAERRGRSPSIPHPTPGSQNPSREAGRQPLAPLGV